MEDKVLSQAEQLYKLGFAIHWLHNKSKRPIESGWTTGPRKEWSDLKKTYKPGLNVGVRLGKPSKIENNFLAVLDIDVKSTEQKHIKEVERKLSEITGHQVLPEVKSGRGNGSRHYYILTPDPIKPFKALQSKETVKVPMPSVAPSKKELRTLTNDEIAKGLRLRPAWEIALMGDGQQVVLPPSIHPDSGKSYKWAKPFESKTAKSFDLSKILNSAMPDIVENPVNGVDKPKPGPKTLEGFEVTPVDISWLPIDDKIKNMIVTGEGVEDRSAMLLPVANALLRAGLTQNEILTVLTDNETYLGHVGYHHAKTANRYKAAAWVYKYSLAKVVEQNKAENFFLAPITKPVKLTKEELAENVELFSELYDWRLDLDTTKNDNIRATLRNVVSIIENEVGEDVVRRDLFSYRDFYKYDTPWSGKANCAITDDDVIKIKIWLANNFKVEPTANIIGEALTVLANRNAFDPIVEWLDGLPSWDGKERIDSWLKNHFEAEGDEDYLAQVFRKWLVAMVMRAYKPGTKFDWMPIFEGAQGVGKSSFGRLLCGDDYFLDWLPDLSNKDSALALQGIWSVEMGELASFRKNEIETVKAFITRTVDKVRPPYGQRWLEVKRRCVFFGTTNFETYLRDDSGNRRFKPVKVGRLDFDALLEDRIQLFAEAKDLYLMGFETEKTLDILGEAKLYETSIQNEKMILDDSAIMEEKIREFIGQELKKNPVERFNFSKFRMSDLFGGSAPFIGMKPLRDFPLNSRNVQLAAKSLKNLGAAKWKSNGERFWKITIT